MHVKRLTLSGFKSYKDSSVELGPATNIVVGRNGSGKSNFFDAIRFVLGDTNDSIRAESRASLLHESTGERSVSAFVEIVFDNSDERLPYETEEVTLRRQVGAKKDEYFVNMKKATKSDISNILESAGFSKSNPYYIVAQGKVSSMATASDEDRLTLLKDVAGTQVYEDRRAESMRILSDSEDKRKEVHLLLETLQARLEELGAESKQLAEYTQYERRKRALEYTLHAGEAARAGEELRTLEETHAADVAGVGAGGAAGGGEALKAEEMALLDAVRNNEADVVANKAVATRAGAERKALESSLPVLTEKRVRIAERARVLKTAIESDSADASSAKAELVGVRAAMDKAQKELDEALIPAHTAAEAALETVRADVASLQARMDALHDKAGRGARFKTRKERDAHISVLLTQLQGDLKRAEERAAAAGKEAAAANAAAAKADAEAGRFEKSAGERAAELPSLEAPLEAAVAARKAAASSSFESKRLADEADRKVAECTVKMEAADRTLYGQIPAHLRRGLETIARLSDPSHTDHIPGIVGVLYDLFKPNNDRYCTAIEVVAGQELFNVVVRDERVAEAIVTYLSRNKAGRVTLVPLSRVRNESQGVEFPKHKDADCLPLVQVMTLNGEAEVALKQTFGWALLCKTSAVAAGYARSHGLTCVTLDGDLANRRGALQGGYVDPSASRLRSLVQKTQMRLNIIEAQGDKRAAEEAAKAADAKQSSAAATITELEDKRRRLRDDVSRLSVDAERKRTEAEGARRRGEEALKTGAAAAATVATLQAQVKEITAEMSGELTSKLSADESRELDTLAKGIESKRASLDSARRAQEEARKARSSVETNISQNLLRRVAELKARISRSSNTDAGERSDQLLAAERELEECMSKEGDARTALGSCVAQEAAAEAKLALATGLLENARTNLEALSERLSEENLREEKFLEKKRAALRRKEEANVRSRALGTIPDAELSKVKTLKRKALVAALSEANDKLKGLSHVNKQAAEQLEQYTEQHESLQSRMKELDKGDASIRDLIDTLDARKDEDIMRTFRGVQKNFREVFAELVPKGSATLKLMLHGDRDEEGGEEEEARGKGRGKSGGAGAGAGAGAGGGVGGVERYKALSIRATFTDAGESKSILLLSGGQKTLVALALILAIQRADPAPFYVFDEVDSALDATHRAAVGALIARQSKAKENPAQFIISTFHPEILSFGDRFFGVSVQNKVSRIEAQSKAQSSGFLLAILKEEQAEAAAGGVGVGAGGSHKKRRGAATEGEGDG